MSHYRYRWYYAGVLFFGLLWLCYQQDIAPMIRDIKALSVRKRHLEQTLQQPKKVHRRTTMPYQFAKGDQLAPALALVMKLVESSQLSTQSIEAMKDKQTQYRLTVQGQFSQLQSLMLHLFDEHTPALITDLSYQTKANNQLQMNIVMRLLNNQLPATVTSLHSPSGKINTEKASPFCTSIKKSMAQYADRIAKLNTTSIDDMQLIGILQQGKHQQIILRLPHQMVVTVRVGSVIGCEQGVVQKIINDRVLLVLPTQAQRMLIMQRA